MNLTLTNAASPKIAIVGAGALGCYYGARLARAGENVHFLMRGDLATVRKRGLTVSVPTETFHLPPETLRTAATPGEIGPCDLVIIALKTTANASFRELITPLLHDGTTILTLQNGLGSDEELAAIFGAEHILGGICFICVNRLAPGEISCTSTGALSLGEFQRPATERLRAIAEKFTRAGVKTTVSDNLIELRWRKLVWNVPFNGLSIAAGGITTDKIMADPVLENEAAALMREIAAAAAAHGCAIPESFVQKQLDTTRPMGAYKPSSLIDYLAKREVEVESIWGEPMRRAKARNVPTPRLEMLHALLHALT
ncbi:2-dehydropantoate 2-reductase [Ereboglobus sp. PH5-5]|uniref:2-dehydropantoate 2-reductase n=1 Tax=Ereboglobus sp. PH5-5 TaxID=2940529 RepID=UPI002405753A|nr:2-dehydropantoate 2-reductase [Ereboglobus sp. PH5-5]MDF9834030.1 2-dehydropantoate 2-reductase [Ereboglobus sp. PH5-5]